MDQSADEVNFQQLSATFEASVTVNSRPQRRPLSTLLHNDSGLRSTKTRSTNGRKSGHSSNRSLPAILMRKRKKAVVDVEVCDENFNPNGQRADSEDAVVVDGDDANDVPSERVADLSNLAAFQAENETTHLLSDDLDTSDVENTDSRCHGLGAAAPVKPANAEVGLNLTLPDDSNSDLVPRSVQLQALPVANSRRRIRLSSPVSHHKHVAERERPGISRVSASPSWLKKIKMRRSWSQFREYVRHVTPIDVCGEPPLRCRSNGLCPLPELTWADKNQVWNLLCLKESGMYERSDERTILARHPHLQANMRSILLDWMMVVSEVYRMNRQTFYLAVDYIDRYLSSARDVPKTSLQLIGVTCLFIAAKIEEIFPPKLSEFAYVTDKACTEEDILAMELVIAKTLNWGLSPMTPHSWIKLYLQTWASKAKSESPELSEVCEIPKCPSSSISEETSFFTAKYSAQIYTEVMQLVDLVILDMESLSYAYSALATCALALTTGELEMALTLSGYELGAIQDSLNWMSSHFEALDSVRNDIVTAKAELKTFIDVSICNQHLIQTHSVDIPLLEKAHCIANERQKQAEERALSDFVASQQMNLQHQRSVAHLSPVTTSSSNILRPEWSINEMTPPTDGSQLGGRSEGCPTKGTNERHRGTFTSYAEAAMAKASITPRLNGSSSDSSIFMSPSSPAVDSQVGSAATVSGEANNVEGIRCTRRPLGAPNFQSLC